MRRLRVLGALLLGCALAGSVEAGPRRVRIVKTDGTVVEGVLEERKDRVYKLTADGKAVSIAESDVLRVDFLGDDAREVVPPRSPWLHAKPGDWATYVTTGRDAAGAVVGTGAITWRVLAVDGADVTVEELEEGPLGAGLHTGHEHKDREFIAGAGWGKYKHEKVAVARDPVTLGDRSFDCTKASIVDEREPPEKTERNAVWIDETLPIGFVEIEHIEDKTGTDTQVLAGYGNGDRVDWGKSPEQVSPRKKVRPWKDVKTGDWWSYATVSDHKPGFETWSAKQADGELIALELGKDFEAHRGDDPLAWLASFVRPGSKVKMIRSATLLDENRTVLGRTFECARLSVECDDDGGRTLRLAYSFAKDGTPPIIACKIEAEGYSFEAELRGYGNGDATAWGKTKAELEAPAPDSIHPWKNVKTGDWWSYAATEEGASDFVQWSAPDATGETLRLRLIRECACERTADALSWLRAATKPSAAITSSTVVASTRTIEGRVFPCWKVSATLVEPGDTKRASIVYWTAVDGTIPVVALEAVEGKKKTTFELRGYGNGETTAWGKTKAELEAPAPEEIQPWKDVKIGDWWSYDVRIDRLGILGIVAKWSVGEGAGETFVLSGFEGTKATPRTASALTWAVTHTDPRNSVVSPSLVPDSRTIGGRTFRCWKVTFAIRDPQGHVGEPASLWTAADGSVPVVAFEFDEAGHHFAYELRGCGNGATTVWGKTEEELSAAANVVSWSYRVKVGPVPRASGDWASYRWELKEIRGGVVRSKGTATFGIAAVTTNGGGTLAVRDAGEGEPARDTFALDGAEDLPIDIVRYVLRVGVKSDVLLGGVAVTGGADDTVTLGAHTFAARKADFLMPDIEVGGEKGSLIAHARFSSGVKATGLVEAELTFIPASNRGMPATIHFELAGSGSESGADFGEKLPTAGDKSSPLH